MSKWLSLVSIAMLALTLTSCKRTDEAVPLVLYNGADPYIMQFKDHINEYAEGRLTMEVYDSQNSQLLQNEIIEEILREDPRILIVNPVDRLGAYTIIEQAKERNIPVIFINREPLPEDMARYDQVYYIGAPAATGAIIQAEMVSELFGSPGSLSVLDRNDDGLIQVVVLKGEQGHQDAEIRTEVVLEELERRGYDLEILSIEICDWQKEIAYDRITQYLEVSPPLATIELVLSNNDYMAIGAIDALREQGFFQDDNEDEVISSNDGSWIPVLGIDAIEEAIDYIDRGFLHGTVLNDSETMSTVPCRNPRSM
jgi:methyl-galactoside transport system substrate-binding protein